MYVVSIPTHHGYVLQNTYLCSNTFSLKTSVKKTVTTSYGNQEANVILNGEPIESGENFSYLCNIMCKNITLNKELNTPLFKAATSFGRLTNRVWSNKSLTLQSQLKV